MNREISNSDDMIDSRDVIARIEALEREIESAEQAVISDLVTAGLSEDEAKAALAGKIGGPDDCVSEETRDELAALEGLAEEAEGYCEDWRHGAQLIRDSYFVEAMRDLLDDIGDLPKNLPGYIAIDWDATAKNLQVDYTSVDFDGVTYWVR